MRQPTPGLDPAGALSDWQQQVPAPEADWTYHSCKLVTPLYGGGVRTGEVDAAMPIRAAGLRGQLRFWWRLSCCEPSTPSAAMFERESAIWGGLGSSQPLASKVAVRVDQVRGLQTGDAFTYQAHYNKPGHYMTSPKEADWIEPYAVFPARGKLGQGGAVIEEAPHRLAQPGLNFRLGLQLHPDLSAQQRQEVDTALRWWASFGGVGARTRRGLGTLQVQGLAPVSAEEVQAKGGQLVLRDASKSTEQAWKISVGRLRDFRQKPDVGRNPSSKDKIPAGRSRWPEPDMLRRQTRRNAPEHPPEHPVQDVYPRAAFGLPIVFHFKDENKGEPNQQLLVPEGGDRLASQLILRPYWDGQRWYPCALLIPGWEQALDVVAQCSPGTDYRAWPRDPAERSRLAQQIKPMAGRGDDPLSAFMAYFQEA